MSETPKLEYACRWTGWVPIPGLPGEETKATRYDFTGPGETGLQEARRIAADTRAWQPHHGLPADAVVVSRPVAKWTEVADA